MAINPTVPALLAPPLANGQLWKLDARYVRIKHVGKLLVEHRAESMERPNQRTFLQMTSIKELEQFFLTHRAVLMQA